MSRESNIQRGISNLKKLNAYIKSTPLNKIPKNQFGQSSQKRILESLGIASSNRDADPIREAFETLNKKLNSKTVTPPPSAVTNDEVKSLQRTISRLQDRIAALKCENENLKSELLSEEWFLETGRMVRFND